GDKIETSQQFIERQEKELIQAVSERARLKDAAEGRKKREHPRKPFDLTDKQKVADMLLCPDERCAIAMIDETLRGSKKDNVPSYVTESGYTEEIPGRTNVGDVQPHSKILILDTESGEGKWLDSGLGTREVTYTAPVFNERGSQAVLIARAVDN